MVNKIGYIRTIEAILAIALLLITTYTIIPRTVRPKQETPLIVKSSQDMIAKEISLNETIRYCIVADSSCENQDYFKTLIKDNIPPSYDYKFKICDRTECIADNLPLEKSVYMSDLLIASTIFLEPKQDPKIFRLWIWKR